MRGFEQRAGAPELMDGPDCDEEKLLRTVSQFTVVNRLFSNASATLRRYVLDDAPSRFSIIDVGAGGCDIMRRLVKACRKRNIEVTVTCLDADPRIVAFAKERSKDYPEIAIRCGRIEALGKAERYDYVFANHLLHHFPGEAIPDTLKRLNRMAKRRVIISDLYRSRWAHLLFGLFAALFFRKSFTRFDGMLSIRKGFLTKEFEAFANAAGIAQQTSVIKAQHARILMISDIKG